VTSTLELSRRFAKAGFTPVQAELLAETAIEIPEANLATKGDLNELRAALKADVNELRAATKADLAELRGEIGRLEQKLDGRFDKLSWMIGLQFALSLLILGKLFFR